MNNFGLGHSADFVQRMKLLNEKRYLNQNEMLNNPHRNYSQALNFIFVQASLFTQNQVLFIGANWL
jgi:hypothetical protein